MTDVRATLGRTTDPDLVGGLASIATGFVLCVVGVLLFPTDLVLLVPIGLSQVVAGARMFGGQWVWRITGAVASLPALVIGVGVEVSGAQVPFTGLSFEPNGAVFIVAGMMIGGSVATALAVPFACHRDLASRSHPMSRIPR